MNVSLGIHSLHLQALFPSKSSNYSHLRFYEKRKQIRICVKRFKFIVQPKDNLYNSKTFLIDNHLQLLDYAELLWKNISLSESCLYTGMFLSIH